METYRKKNAMSVKETENILLKFLAALKNNDDAFPKQKINIFKAAGLVRQEIRHSNLLAFFLNPAQPHGLADEFLKILLSNLPHSDTKSRTPFSRVYHLMNSLSDIQVRREVMNIDVLIWSEKSRFLLAIESKIDADQGSNQLEKYRINLENKFPDYELQLVYLTVNGDPPNDSSWVIATWNDIFEALQAALFKKIPFLAQEAIFAADQYLDLIKTEIIMEEANLPLIEVCRKIYSEHKKAIDLIIKHGAISSFTEGAEQFFGEKKELVQYSIGPSRAVFLPRNISEACKKSNFTLEQTRGFFGKNNAIVMWFSYEENKIRLILEIGPWENEGRENLVQKIKKTMVASPEVISRNKTTATYSRIWTATENIDEDPSVDRIVEAMTMLYTKVAPHINSIADVIARV